MGAEAWVAYTSHSEAAHLSSREVALPEGVGAMVEQKHPSVAKFNSTWCNSTPLVVVLNAYPTGEDVVVLSDISHARHWGKCVKYIGLTSSPYPLYVSGTPQVLNYYLRITKLLVTTN